MKKFYLALLLVAMFTGCDIFDKDETIPGYIVINEINVSTVEAIEGVNTHDIVDATVFANDQFVGTYELPATIPILENGPTTLNISGGIKNNGLVDNRVIYPFYNFVLKDVDLMPDVKTPISEDSTVTVEYFNSINFAIEDFENVGILLEPEDDDNAELTVISEPAENVSRGQSLQVTLDPLDGVFHQRTTFNLTDLPKGNQIYLEIEFKGEVPLEVGIVTEDAPIVKNFAGGINPTDEWKKIYFEFSRVIGSQPQNDEFEVYLESRSTSLTKKQIFIDNIKLVYP